MPTNVTISVPSLPDTGVWFANNAAWQSYWNGANLTINIATATTSATGVVKKATTVAYNLPDTSNNNFSNFIVDGVNFIVPAQDNYNQLKAAFVVLQTDHQALKASLVAAGLITLA